ncbi:MAG: AAA family ATPase [Desulfobulbaceae bacterium]|nr:AAA family ATPase [Desulfobulbaceae bacterium]
MHLKKVIIGQDRFPTREAYPFNLPFLQKTPCIPFRTPVTLFTGENGTGKSTLLLALCRRCNIHIWEGQSKTRCETNPYEHLLHRVLDIEWTNGSVPGSFFSPELFRNFTQLVDEWASTSPELLEYFGGKSLITQSHGQSCMSFFKSRYKIKGLHFLDEPEAALSPKSQLELLNVITEMSSAGHAQFIISTHSPILMSCTNAVLYNFSSSAIEPLSYKETEHYRVYRDFFRKNE